MKKSLILHIGMGKTGTTALQVFFSENRRALEKNGISYPKFGEVSGAHHLLSPHVPPFLQGVWEFKSVEEWAPKLEKTSAEKILVSSELIAWSNDNLVREFCASIQKWFEVTVVIYLRRQDNIIMASYNQQLKAGSQKRSIIDIHQNLVPKFNYESILRPWEETVGAHNIIVRPYEKKQLFSRDIRRDFMRNVLDIEGGESFVFSNRNPNASLSKKAGEYKRLINNIVEDKKKNQRFTELLSGFSRIIKPTQDEVYVNESLLPPNIRLKIIQSNDELNNRVAEKYLGPATRKLFLDPLPDPKEAWTGNELSQAEATFVSEYLIDNNPKLMLWLDNELVEYRENGNKLQQYASLLLASTMRGRSASS